MKIAVWINYSYSPKVGGTFSYVDRLIKAIDEYDFNSSLEICFATSAFVEIGDVKKELIRLCTPAELVLSKLPFFSRIKIFQRIARRMFNNTYRDQLSRKGVRLLFYPSQFERILPKFPFIISHWDIAHRSTYAFPEFSFFLQESRDAYYANILSKALMIFVESEAGKKELVMYSNINEERIRVVPIFPGECANSSISQEEQKNILKKFGLEKEKYFYYPAQFLAEKNHIIIVKAFSIISSKYPDFKVLFTGSSSKELFGTIDYIKSQTRKYNVEDRFVFGGFVSQNEVYCFYKNACAHIMASYVGPTNMPPLEAMAIGCPVICTDLSGHKEEMGDAALYFDARRDEQLAVAMEKMILNRKEYVDRINEHAKVCNFNIDSAMESINTNMLEAKIVRETWN